MATDSVDIVQLAEPVPPDMVTLVHDTIGEPPSKNVIEPVVPSLFSCPTSVTDWAWTLGFGDTVRPIVVGDVLIVKEVAPEFDVR